MAPRPLRLLRPLLIVAAVTLVATFGIIAAWTAIGGGALPLHGRIALGLGVAGTVALAWALMALAFRSSRDGWDERADARPGDHDKP